MQKILKIARKIREKIYLSETSLLLYVDLDNLQPQIDNNLEPGLHWGFSNDVDAILDFYTKHSWSPFKKSRRKLFEDTLKKGHRCFALYDNEKNILGTTWIGFNKTHFNRFIKRKHINCVKEREFLYIWATLIDSSKRGLGHGQVMNQKLFNTLTKEIGRKYVCSQVDIKNSPSLGYHFRTGFQLYGIVFRKRFFMYFKSSELILK